MPELPDVQVFKETIDATSLHKSIASVAVRVDDLREHADADVLREHLMGHRWSSTRRHGKHLFVEIADGGWLRLHFGMTGTLELGKDLTPPEHWCLCVGFDDGYRLCYVNVRKFGEVGWIEDVSTFLEKEGLGPDAMDDLETTDDLRDLLSDRRGMIKTALTDQSFIAGIGNVYADEMLLRARVHPETRVQDIDDGTIEDLYEAMRGVLEDAIAARAVPEEMPDGFILPDRDDGAPCPQCDGTLKRIEVGGRATYVCPTCQDPP